MSHVTASKVKITDIEALAEAVNTGCPDLEMVKANEYRTWVTDNGSLAGDYALAVIYQLQALVALKKQGINVHQKAAEVGVTLPENLIDLEKSPLTVEQLGKLKQLPDFARELKAAESRISKDASYVIRYKKSDERHKRSYEIGVVEHPYKKGAFTLMTDFWQNGKGLFDAKGLGKHKTVEKDGKTQDDWGHELRQRYTVIAMRNRAQKEGKKVTKVETLPDGSIRMEVTE